MTSGSWTFCALICSCWRHRRHAGLPDLEAEDEVDAVDANDGDGEMEEVLLEPEPKPEADGMG